jgi:hypothetical protein
MDFPSQAVIAVLTYLLPGFVTAALVYTLTPSLRPIPFERVVQALIFTMLVQVGVVGIEFVSLSLGSRAISLGAWTENVRPGMVGRVGSRSRRWVGMGGEHRQGSWPVANAGHHVPNVVLFRMVRCVLAQQGLRRPASHRPTSALRLARRVAQHARTRTFRHGAG